MQCPVAAQRFDVGSAEEYPQKARNERDPCREQRAEHAGAIRRQAARMAERGDESYVLHHHDQWARRRLRECQTIEHFAGTEPAITLHRTLRDVGKHRIRTTKRHDRGFAEEHTLLREDAGSAEIRSRPRESVRTKVQGKRQARQSTGATNARYASARRERVFDRSGSRLRPTSPWRWVQQNCPATNAFWRSPSNPAPRTASGNGSLKK